MKSTVCKDSLNFSNLIYLYSHYLSVIIFLSTECFFLCLLTHWVLGQVLCYLLRFFFSFLNSKCVLGRPFFSRLFSWLLSCTAFKLKTTQKDWCRILSRDRRTAQSHGCDLIFFTVTSRNS